MRSVDWNLIGGLFMVVVVATAILLCSPLPMMRAEALPQAPNRIQYRDLPNNIPGLFVYEIADIHRRQVWLVLKDSNNDCLLMLDRYSVNVTCDASGTVSWRRGDE